MAALNQLPDAAAKHITATSIGAGVMSARDWLSIAALVFLLIGIGAWAIHFVWSYVRPSTTSVPTVPVSKSETEPTPSGGRLFPIKIIQGPAPQIFVSHIGVVFETLQTEGCIIINIGVVACMNLELEKLAVGGISLKSTAFAAEAKAFEIKTVTLDAPSVLEVAGQSVLAPSKAGPTFPLYRGVSTVMLKQYLAPVVHTGVSIAVASKKQTLEFDLTGLKLTVLVPEVGNVRLPLWDGVICRPGMAFSRVLSMSVSMGLSGPPKLQG